MLSHLLEGSARKELLPVAPVSNTWKAARQAGTAACRGSRSDLRLLEVPTELPGSGCYRSHR